MDKNDLTSSHDDGPTTFDKFVMWMLFAALAIGLGFAAWALLVHA